MRKHEADLENSSEKCRPLEAKAEKAKVKKKKAEKRERERESLFENSRK